MFVNNLALTAADSERSAETKRRRAFSPDALTSVNVEENLVNAAKKAASKYCQCSYVLSVLQGCTSEMSDVFRG